MALEIDDKQFVESPLPNVHVKTITLSPAKDNKISLRLDMIVQERIVGSNPPLWFESEDFLNALTILVVAVTKEQQPSFLAGILGTYALNWGGDPNNFTWAQHLKFKDFISNSELTLRQELKSNYSHINSDGEVAYDIPFDHTFEIEETDHLTCYCIPILDLSAILDPADLEGEAARLNGNMTVEHVINKGTIISEKEQYKTSDGKIWQGPTHVMADGHIHTGFTHSEQYSAALTVEHIPNNKVQDFRLHQAADAVKIDLEYVEEKIFIDNPIKLNTNDIEKNASYFSDFFTSRSNDGLVNFLFGFDHAKACRDNSKYGALMDRSLEAKGQILMASQLTELTVSRRRITDTKNQSKIGTPVKNEPFEKNEEYQEIISAQSTPTSFSADTDDGVIREIPLGIQEGLIKFFTGSDKSIATSEKGLYQYDVRIEIVDGARELLKNKLETLMAAQNTLQEYYTKAIGYAPGTQKLNFHLKSRRFTPRFIAEIYENEDSFDKEETAIANYAKILRLLGDSTLSTSSNNEEGGENAPPPPEDELNTFFLNLIKPDTGSPEGISIAMKSVGDLIARLTELLGMDTADKGTKSSSSQTPKNSFTIKKKFYSTVDNSTPRSLGINYFSKTKKTSGLHSITKGKYNTRMKNELARYYKSPTESHTSHFSPTNIDLPGVVGMVPLVLDPVSSNHWKKLGQTAAFLTTGQTTSYIRKSIDYTRETLEKKNIKITPHIAGLNLSPSLIAALLPQIADSDTVGREPDFDSAAYLKSIKEKEYKPLFASLTQESDPNLPESIEFFGAAPGGNEQGPLLKAIFASLPTQLQSLVGVTSINTAYKDWHAEAKDLFSNSELFPILLLNYLLLVEVEYLVGFTQTGEAGDKETSLLLPSWAPVSEAALNNKKGVLLCRIKKYSNNAIGMKYAKVSAPINNEYFLLENN